MSQEAEVTRLEDYRPPSHLIDTVDLDVRLAPTATKVRARLSIRPNPECGEPDLPLALDGEGLKPEGILVDGAPPHPDHVTVTDTHLTLHRPPQAPFTLETTVTIDPSANTALMGLYRSNDVYCTQCEAEGFRRITYFLDRPDVLSVFTVRIEARRGEAPVLLANGNPVEAGDIEGTDRHYAIWHDPHPKPSYLFALVGGELGLVRSDFTTASGRAVDLRVYVETGKEAKADFAMEALKRSMRWDEERFGREYDLDVFSIVAVSHFNMGAMENKGLNIFNDKYILASPDTATDTDYASIDAIIAHEYFHNWTGNRITCRDWFQLCLKEGLTVFRDQEYSADTGSRAVERIGDVKMLRNHQFAEDAGPLAHPVRPEQYREINNFYTATVYEKGAEVIRMLKALIGDDAFDRGMQLYFERHDGRAATVEEFIACFAEAAGRDLDQFMRWYSQAGTPVVTVTAEHDAPSKTLKLTLEQMCPPTPGQPDKAPMELPVRLGLLDGATGAPIVLPDGATETTVALRQSRDTVSFSGIETRPVVSLMRGFSAPVKVVHNIGQSEQLLLLTSDPDPFNRWEAGQKLMRDALADAAAKVRDGEAPAFDGAVVAAIVDLADVPDLEPAFRTQLITPPTDTVIAQTIGSDIDPDAIHTSREAMLVAIGRTGAQRLEALYRSLATNAPYSPDPVSAGRRALRNMALTLMTAADPATGLDLAAAQFETADNMTDRFAALTLLAHRGGGRGVDALGTFYERYRADPLVIDKWFALKAMTPGAGSLAIATELTAHPAFKWDTPNRVRSVFGAFAEGNPTGFNRADGTGYDFVADAVLKLDATNPQVAARLLAAFRSWRMLEPGRRARAEAALRKVADRTGLSADVADIAQRSLAD